MSRDQICSAQTTCFVQVSRDQINIDIEHYLTYLVVVDVLISSVCSDVYDRYWALSWLRDTSTDVQVSRDQCIEHY